MLLNVITFFVVYIFFKIPEDEDGTASCAEEVDGDGFEPPDSLKNLVDRGLRLLRITISSWSLSLNGPSIRDLFFDFPCFISLLATIALFLVLNLRWMKIL